MLGLILAVIIVGFIAGIIARALLPGDDSMTFAATTAIGIAGSFLGGFLGYLLFHKNAQSGLIQPSGIIGSVIGAMIILAFMRRKSHSRTA